MDEQSFRLEVIDRLARLEEVCKNLGTRAEIDAMKQDIHSIKEDVEDVQKELVWYRRGIIGGLLVTVAWLFRVLLKL